MIGRAQLDSRGTPAPLGPARGLAVAPAQPAQPRGRPAPEEPLSPQNFGPLGSAAGGRHSISALRARESQLRRCATAKDIADVRSMCREINPERAPEIFEAFWDSVIATQASKPAAVAIRDAQLPDDWFHEPFYYLYVQYFGTEPGATEATFDDLTERLDYLEELGVRNLYLLPHYESPMADGGYDVSAYEPRESLGGRPAYDRFMAAALERGFRVVTDAPFNHTSVRHAWFESLVRGDQEKGDYYVRVDGREKVGERLENGDVVCKYRDPDGVETELVSIFPDVDRTHSLRVKTPSGDAQIFREFYPFQVDLDLRNPNVLKEIFQLLGREANDGVLGKRTDAIAHWLKRPGTKNDGLPETHALHGLLKSYLRHVSPKSIIMPEAVRSARVAAGYAGIPTRINDRPTASEGDAIFAFELQGALREMLYFQTSEAFWSKVLEQPDLPDDATWVNLLGHHDETYLGFVSEKNRFWMGEYIESKGGTVYKEGMSAGARFADCLDRDPRRIAMALFTLYNTPGTPALYFGAEVGATNQPAHAQKMQAAQGQRLRNMGIDVSDDRAFDPRELQRGPIPKADFERARRSEALGFRTVKRLNALRRSHPGLRSTAITPLSNGHDGVLSMLRLAERPEDDLVSLANLTGHPKELRIPCRELTTRGDFRADAPWWDLMTSRRVDAKVSGDHLVVRLPPFGFALLSPRALRRPQP